MQHTQPSILLVDASDAQRCALRSTLEKAGFAVEEAADGRQALACAAGEPDLILLGVDLPDVDGLDVCRQLKANSATAPIPVIRMSACFIHDEDKVEGLCQGADDYITRPTSSAELLARLKTWLRVRRAEAELRARSLEPQAASEAPRSSEHEFRDIFQLAGLGEAQGDAQGRFLRVNQKFCEITGYSESELLQLSAVDITHPDDRASSRDGYARMMRGETNTYRADKRYLRRDGSIVWVRVTATPVRDSSGKAIRAVGIIEDITERKNAEQALRGSERLLQSMLDSSPSIIFLKDLEGRFITINSALENLLGRSRAELRGRTDFDIFPADVAAYYRAHDRHVLEVGESVQFEEVADMVDGRHVFLATRFPIFDAAGQPCGIGSISHDITHFNRMQRELTEAKELVETRLAQFHATINSMTEGVCFFDASGEAVLVNQAFFRIYGFPPECLPESTRKLFSLSEAYDRNGKLVPPTQWPLYAALRGEVVKHRELQVRRTDTGREVILSHNAAPVRDSSGHVVMAVVTVEDITAMKQAEEALVRSEKLASVGRMAATVAHEINNPLAAVMNTLYLARSARDLPASVRSYLDLADSELQRIAHITRQALGFYREPAAPASTSVAAVMDSAVDLLKSKIKAKHAVVQRQFEQAPTVVAIAGELRQVFSNLLANSLDAVADNGVVKLRISTMPRPNSDRYWVRVTVADNGRGIDPAVLPHIFEPFFTTKKSVGTGLGLWVSKQIMDKHGGCIRVRSRVHGPQRGTVFSLVLPAEAEVSLPLRAVGGGS